MTLQENDIVKIVDPPQGMLSLQDAIGFINSKTNANLEIAVLDDTGLREIFVLPETSVVLDQSEGALKLFKNYKKTLEAIKAEADERQRKRTKVANFLAKKYNISPDEVYGIYKIMLNYDEYYDENFRHLR